MTFVLFIGLWLGAYRLTRILTKDSLFERQREWWFRWFPPDESYASLRPGKLENGTRFWRQESRPCRKVSKWGQLIDCSWCCGAWVSAFTVAIVASYVPIRLPVLYALAVSTAVGLTGARLDRSD